jgi:hypothetical protein
MEFAGKLELSSRFGFYLSSSLVPWYPLDSIDTRLDLRPGIPPPWAMPRIAILLIPLRLHDWDYMVSHFPTSIAVKPNLIISEV